MPVHIDNRPLPISFPIESMRRMIAWTGRAPGIGNLYASVYHSAVRHLVRAVSSLDGTLSVLTRNSYADGSFTPGSSDIDVVVVIRDDLDARTIKSLLASLWLVCARLRRRFPMLSRFPVYTRQSFIATGRLAPLKMETYAWRCEWGDDQLLSMIQEPHKHDPLEIISRGIQVYIGSFHGNLRAALEAGKTRTTLALERSAYKIERVLGQMAPFDDFVSQGSITEVVVAALSATTRALESIEPDLAPHAYRVIDSREDPRQEVCFDPKPVPDNIDGIIGRRNGFESWYILPFPVTAHAVESALELTRHHPSESTRTILLTASFFKFFLRHVNPMTYYILQATRIVRAKDIFQQIQPPSETGIRRFFCYEANHMLRLPIQPAFGNQQAPGALSAHQQRFNRFVRFIEQDEFLLEDGSSQPFPSQDGHTETLVDLMLRDMPEILDRLNDSPAALYGEGPAESS